MGERRLAFMGAEEEVLGGVVEWRKVEGKAEGKLEGKVEVELFSGDNALDAVAKVEGGGGGGLLCNIMGCT